MTLERKIAECNLCPGPYRWFIDTVVTRLNYLAWGTDRNSCFSVDNCATVNYLMGRIAPRLKLDWLDREAIRPLHPTIVAMVNEHECDWFGIMMEWPHVSQDGERLAYTRNAAAGVNGRQTVTSLGKYLARHFSELPSNVLRDAAALFTPDKFEVYTTTEDIVRGVQEGPNSCMKWSQSTPVDSHPYSCYAPENGWTLAVRIAGNSIDGRCLCHTSDKGRIFVRSFKRDMNNPTSGYSYSDVALESWLKAQGYEHHSEWGRHCRLNTQGSTLFPYIDGNVQKCNDDGYIDEDGDYQCDNTDGTHSGEDEGGAYAGTCIECNRTVYEDDSRIWAGRFEDDLVCGDCEDSYTWAFGRNGEQYYVHRDNVLTIGDYSYDSDYLSDNNIVELEDGEYAQLDDAVLINGQYYLEDDAVLINGQYYLEDDDDVVYFDDSYHLISDDSTMALDEKAPGRLSSYAHVDDTWECAETNNTYHNLTPHVLIGGEKYHLDTVAARDLAEFEAKQLLLELETL